MIGIIVLKYCTTNFEICQQINFKFTNKYFLRVLSVLMLIYHTDFLKNQKTLQIIHWYDTFVQISAIILMLMQKKF